MTDTLIYGAGGFAREVAWLVSDCAETTSHMSVRAFVDDDPAKWGTTLNGIPVVSMDKARHEWPGSDMLIGVGGPAAREAMAERAEAAGFRFPAILHPRIEMSELVAVGDGTIVCAGCILTVNITIGILMARMMMPL